jgi:hypothetical protein
MTSLCGVGRSRLEFLWELGAYRRAAEEIGGVDSLGSRMVVLNFERRSTQRRQPRLVVSLPMGESAPPSSRLPLGSFTQGRSLRRALLETSATIVALALVIVGLALLGS